MSGFHGFYPERLLPRLPRDTVQVQPDAIHRLDPLLSSGLLKTLIIIAYGSGGDAHAETLLYKRRDALLNWVRGGGCLILHGERHISLLLRHCELPWQMGAYTRETHLLASKDNGVVLANPSLARLTPTISVKATLLTDVNPAHRLYVGPPQGRQNSDPQSCAALVSIGRGHLAYFGDVNAEEPTLAAIQLLSELSVEGNLRSSDVAAVAAPVAPPGGAAVDVAASHVAHDRRGQLECCQCQHWFVKASFSGNQLRRGVQRRCRACITANAAAEEAERHNDALMEEATQEAMMNIYFSSKMR
jgi:hypothetical protein